MACVRKREGTVMPSAVSLCSAALRVECTARMVRRAIGQVDGEQAGAVGRGGQEVEANRVQLEGQCAAGRTARR